VSLPLSPKLTDRDVTDVVCAVRKVLGASPRSMWPVTSAIAKTG